MAQIWKMSSESDKATTRRPQRADDPFNSGVGRATDPCRAPLRGRLAGVSGASRWPGSFFQRLPASDAIAKLLDTVSTSQLCERRPVNVQATSHAHALL